VVPAIIALDFAVPLPTNELTKSRSGRPPYAFLISFGQSFFYF
jgi:hypothetical protein